MVMGVLKYAPKWITITTKGESWKWKIFVLSIWASQRKFKIENHIQETIPNLTTLNFEHKKVGRLCVFQNVLKWTIPIRGERKKLKICMLYGWMFWNTLKKQCQNSQP
jgi:hypothetical protein